MDVSEEFREVALGGAALDRLALLMRRRASRSTVASRADSIARTDFGSGTAAELMAGWVFRGYGNADSYYDPDNSFLNRVLDRGLGIPISLSVLRSRWVGA
jgi:regulator of sirC expression with transglutaminase-like and TPR domain